MNKTCILCGKHHEKGQPCDFTGADSILAGKITIPKPTEGNELKVEPIVYPPLKWLRKHG